MTSWDEMTNFEMTKVGETNPTIRLFWVILSRVTLTRTVSSGALSVSAAYFAEIGR